MSEFINDIEIDLSLLEKDGKTEFSEKIKLHKEKTTKAFQDFVVNLKIEATETHQASKIMLKYIKEGDITKEEEKEFRLQVYDLLKILGIGIPFALIPGASLLIPFVVKVAERKGVKILPTAFNKNANTD